mmetsp:Transcript_9098/g.17836  ORF Transcript_9098/g.17836 Transcript_9098/m.17836 type:complete len:130 (-) Transcript_9098:828-1217(-)
MGRDGKGQANGWMRACDMGVDRRTMTLIYFGRLTGVKDGRREGKRQRCAGCEDAHRRIDCIERKIRSDRSVDSLPSSTVSLLRGERTDRMDEGREEGRESKLNGDGIASDVIDILSLFNVDSLLIVLVG